MHKKAVYLFMTEPEPYFVIPTHRLRDVGAAIHEYDEHFWKNGHSVQMIIFDDSTQANVDKYLPTFEQTRTRSELFYVGPRDKEEFISYINARLQKAFNGFEPDFFQHNLVRIMDDAIGVIKSTLELWPTLVEICYFQKLRHGLPMRRIGGKSR